MKLARPALLLTALCATIGCSIEPWVAPYERQNIADPIMSFDRDAVASKYLNHVYESRESARGSEGSSGGGCGCN